MSSTETIRLEDYKSPEAVFNRYADMVYRLAFVRTKSSNDSDDILQEVFLRYIRVWNTVRSEEHIKALLIRITVNCSNSLLTSYWFKKTEGLDENLSNNGGINDDYALNAVLKLPLKYRTVIHLHYYMGYSVNEIAEITKTNPSTVKTRLMRGREQLKKLLDTEDL